MTKTGKSCCHSQRFAQHVDRFGLVLFNLRLRWLGRQLHMAASFYSHHHHCAGRRPIRAAKKPGGMGSVAPVPAMPPAPTRFPSTVIVCQLIENPARWQDVWPVGRRLKRMVRVLLQTRNSNSIFISISLPSCIIHARARCRCWAVDWSGAERRSLQCGKVLHATRFPGDSFINFCQRLTRAYSSTQECTEKKYASN